MTEDAWLKTRRGAVGMYTAVASRLAVRKLHLLGAAVFRRGWPASLSDPDAAALVEAVEGFAEGHVGEAAFVAARQRAYSDTLRREGYGLALCTLMNAHVRDGVRTLVGSAGGRYRGGSVPVHPAELCDLIREIAGNPFRPWKAIPEAMGGGLVQPDGATVFPSPAARAVAAGIAADQGFDRLPVLADALEDSGVTDAELLAHCRRPGGHLRGCWAVDVVLGRA